MNAPGEGSIEGYLARLAGKVVVTAGSIRQTRRSFQEWERHFANHPLFRQLSAKVRAAWRFLKDPKVPMRDRAIVLAAVVYVVMPFDLIPDYIPVIGLMDDLAVITLALAIVCRNREPTNDRERHRPRCLKPRV